MGIEKDAKVLVDGKPATVIARIDEPSVMVELMQNNVRVLVPVSACAPMDNANPSVTAKPDLTANQIWGWAFFIGIFISILFFLYFVISHSNYDSSPGRYQQLSERRSQWMSPAGGIVDKEAAAQLQQNVYECLYDRFPGGVPKGVPIEDTLAGVETFCVQTQVRAVALAAPQQAQRLIRLAVESGMTVPEEYLTSEALPTKDIAASDE